MEKKNNYNVDIEEIVKDALLHFHNNLPETSHNQPSPETLKKLDEINEKIDGTVSWKTFTIFTGIAIAVISFTFMFSVSADSKAQESIQKYATVQSALDSLNAKFDSITEIKVKK